VHALKTPWVTDCSEDAYKLGSPALCVEGDCHGVGAARSRANSRAGSKSSVTGCASTATRPGPPRSLSRPRSSTECSTLGARTPSASPDQQRGMGTPSPLPPPCNTLADDPKLKVNVHGRRHASGNCRGDTAAKLPTIAVDTMIEVKRERSRRRSFCLF